VVKTQAQAVQPDAQLELLEKQQPAAAQIRRSARAERQPGTSA
jgi:hypothetical protein